MNTVSNCANLGVVVNTGCQIIMLDRNVNIDKSD